MFAWISKNNCASQSSHERNLRNHFWQILNLRVCHVCLCSVGKFGRHCKRQTLAVERKRWTICIVKICQENWERISLWCQKAPLFRHALILLPVSGILGDFYFCIYLFYHMFILFFMLLLFYNFLLNPHKLYISKDLYKCSNGMFDIMSTYQTDNYSLLQIKQKIINEFKPTQKRT